MFSKSKFLQEEMELDEHEDDHDLFTQNFIDLFLELVNSTGVSHSFVDKLLNLLKNFAERSKQQRRRVLEQRFQSTVGELGDFIVHGNLLGEINVTPEQHF